jgi:hypothetical protein
MGGRRVGRGRSRDVALLHDYGLYDWTMSVKPADQAVPSLEPF